MRRPTSLLILTLLVAAPALAQTAPTPGVQIAPTATTPTPMAGQTAPPAPPAPPRAPNLQTQTNLLLGPVNIKLDLVITDNYAGTPIKKSVSLLVLNGNSGIIRTNNYQTDAVLNVDAVANAYQNGSVSLRLTFDYSPAPMKDSAGRNTRSPRLNESITVVLQDGKPLVVSQSADPGSERRVTVELTATILK